MTPTLTPYRPAVATGRDGFLQLLHAEWTKFRTVRGWMAGMALAALMVVLVALLAGVSSDQNGSPPVPIGPGSEPVTDSFYFVHKPLDGDGVLTVAVDALDSSVPTAPDVLGPGVVPWAKAGLIIKRGTEAGSTYAAIMVTGTHGVRMQHDYVNDTAAPVTVTSVRWLRLVRTGDTITGHASSDGAQWTEVGAVHLEGLGQTAEGGLFVASPQAVDGLGTTGSVSTAAFADLRTEGAWAAASWTGEQLGPESPTFAGYPPDTGGSFTESADGFTVTGAGDIAPAVRYSLPTGGTRKDILTGAFAALVAVTVVGALFITSEYRNNLIHVTFAAGPRRSRMLLAKAIVLGGATFVAGLAGALLAAPLGERLARAYGVYIFPVSAATGLRVALGTAALLAAASVLALAVGALFRHSAAAVATVIVVLVLPYLLIANPFMPASVANGLTRVTPAAAFAVQQTLVPYSQVESIYSPYNGYFPLAPWAGLAVLAGYAVVSLAAAAVLLRRRDA